MEPRTFRATVEAWFGQLLLPLTVFVLLTVTMINRAGLSPWIGGLGLVVLVMIALIEYLLPMLRNWLFLDAYSIEGSLNGRSFRIYWTEVLAAWMVERRGQHFLCIGTRNGALIIPLRFFNMRDVWDRARVFLPPAALEETAIQRLPDYQVWSKSRSELPGDESEPRTVVDHWLVQVIGWGGVTFFLFGAAKMMHPGAIEQMIVFLCLAIVDIFLLLHWGVTEVSAIYIERHTLFGSWRILWEDVRWIEIDPTNSVIVFVGEQSQLMISGPRLWNGVSKQEALATIIAQAEQRKIPLRRTLLVVLRSSRKTRVKR